MIDIFNNGVSIYGEYESKELVCLSVAKKH